MSSEHILVDGYSMLHRWEELNPALRRGLAAGRDAMVLLLTQFHDSYGGELTVVFDGQSVSHRNEKVRIGIRVIYSRKEETADAIIERIVGQSKYPHHFLVATDDHAERNIVESLGAQTISAAAFHAMIEEELKKSKNILKQLSIANRHFSK